MQNNNKNTQQELKEKSSSDIDNVDKIRDILFGNQIKDFEYKFRQLQEQINKELNDLKDDSIMRFDSLENFVKSEFESLNLRLEGEQRMRISDIDESADKFETRIKKVSHALSEQERQNNDKARELRQLLLEQSKELFDKMNQKQLDDREMLISFRNELDAGKVDRSALSSLFTNLALQVSTDNFSDELLNNKN